MVSNNHIQCDWNDSVLLCKHGNYNIFNQYLVVILRISFTFWCHEWENEWFFNWSWTWGPGTSSISFEQRKLCKTFALYNITFLSRSKCEMKYCTINTKDSKLIFLLICSLFSEFADLFSPINFFVIFCIVIHCSASVLEVELAQIIFLYFFPCNIFITTCLNWRFIFVHRWFNT